MIDISLPIKPLTVNQAFRSIPRGKFCTSIKSASYRQFEKDMSALLPKKKKIEGEVSVTIEFYLKYYATTDLDNLTKTTIDCLASKEYFENDKLITSLNLSKYKAEEDSIRIIITEA